MKLWERQDDKQHLWMKRTRFAFILQWNKDLSDSAGQLKVSYHSTPKKAWIHGDVFGIIFLKAYGSAMSLMCVRIYQWKSFPNKAHYWIRGWAKPAVYPIRLNSSLKPRSDNAQGWHTKFIKFFKNSIFPHPIQDGGSRSGISLQGGDSISFIGARHYKSRSN